MVLNNIAWFLRLLEFMIIDLLTRPVFDANEPFGPVTQNRNVVGSSNIAVFSIERVFYVITASAG